MNTPTIPPHQKKRLQAHFGFTKVPFRKNMQASEMFDSRAQRELFQGLLLWTEVKGLALVTGPAGVGKSITLRRFARELDEARFRVVQFSWMPSRALGFLRSLNRALALPLRQHAADLFDQAQKHLATFAQDHGPHPVLILDDAEGMDLEVLDLVRRLTAYELDAEDRFSILIAGTDDLLRRLRHPALDPLRTRIGYAQVLRPFSLEDTRNYVAFHVQRAGGDTKLFTDDACRRIFQAAHGRPRAVNQLALQSLIQAAVEGCDAIAGDFVAAQIQNHPFYQVSPGDTP